MAIIYTYPTKSTPTLGDLILISDTSAKNLTKNATISSLKDAIDVVDSVIAGSGILVSSATGNVTISTPAYSGQSSIGIEALVIICVSIWPQLALWLPNKMIG